MVFQQLDNVEEGDNMFADQYAEEQDAELDDLTPHQKRLTFDREDKGHLDEFSSEDEGEEEPEFDEISDEEIEEQQDENEG